MFSFGSESFSSGETTVVPPTTIVTKSVDVTGGIAEPTGLIVTSRVSVAVSMPSDMLTSTLCTPAGTPLASNRTRPSGVDATCPASCGIADAKPKVVAIGIPPVGHHVVADGPSFFDDRAHLASAFAGLRAQLGWAVSERVVLDAHRRRGRRRRVAADVGDDVGELEGLNALLGETEHGIAGRVQDVLAVVDDRELTPLALCRLDGGDGDRLAVDVVVVVEQVDDRLARSDPELVVAGGRRLGSTLDAGLLDDDLALTGRLSGHPRCRRRWARRPTSSRRTRACRPCRPRCRRCPRSSVRCWSG